MGFGANLFFIFVLLPLIPLTGVLIVLWLKSESKLLLGLIQLIWGGLFAGFLLIVFVQFCFADRGIKKRHIYGEYIIDRSMFAGKQADWQYNTYRFEINKNNQLIFYQTEGDAIVQADTALVSFVENYHNTRIRIHSQQKAMHHILNDSPTLYRRGRSFYYVFRSPQYGNVFFKKGEWKPLSY